MNSKVLIIVGMHRSGTSVVTQWLNRCGLFVGTNLVGPGIGNLQGHFEDEDFLRIHQKFLRKRNFPESGFVYKRSIELSELEKMELRGLITSKSRKHEEWGWKEPRTSLFLNGYAELVPAAFYVIVVRNFNATINSLVTRQFNMERKKIQEKKGLSRLKWILFKRRSLDKMFQKETNRYLKIWIHYYENILQHIRSVPNERLIIVNYAQLNFRDEDLFSRIKNDWNFSLNYSPFKKLYNPGLLSEVRDVKQYIKNKELEKKAMAIEETIHAELSLAI
jgi:hypothetical protein